jgi:hypothetical protein
MRAKSLVRYNTPMPRGFQFSLKWLLAAMVPLSIWLAIVPQAARTQREVVAKIEAKGGSVLYRHQRTEYPGGEKWDRDKPPPVPQWLRKWLGDDYFQTVVDVWLFGDKFSDEDLDEIVKLKSLEWMTIDDDTPVSNEALQRLQAALPGCECECLR